MGMTLGWKGVHPFQKHIRRFRVRSNLQGREEAPVGF